jgi:hypothetical protein
VLAARLGCTAISGDVFGAPVSPAELNTMLDDQVAPEALKGAMRDVEAEMALVVRPGAAVSLPSTNGSLQSAPAPAGRDLVLSGERSELPPATIALGEAAAQLHMSPSTLRRRADEKWIRSARTPGGHRRFSVSEIGRLRNEARYERVAVVRPVPPPVEAMPGLAALLNSRGASLLRQIIDVLYLAPQVGWFASPDAMPPLATWLDAVTAAAVDPRMIDAAKHATKALIRQGMLGGASMLELHRMVESFGEVIGRCLQAQSVTGAEIQQAGRTFSVLRRTVLEVPMI